MGRGRASAELPDVSEHVASAMAAATDNDGARTIELPLERFDRLLILLERLAQAQERTLVQRQDTVRRAAAKTTGAGPIPPEVEARVAARVRKIRGRS